MLLAYQKRKQSVLNHACCRFRKRHKLSVADINAKDTCLGILLLLPSNWEEGCKEREKMETELTNGRVWFWPTTAKINSIPLQYFPLKGTDKNKLIN